MTAEHIGLDAALRELRARTGLSLAALAQRTAFSKSSWERYLNAKSLPPRQAVQQLCRLADEPDGRLLALWEITESHWSGRATVLAAAPETLPAPPRPKAGQPRDGTGRRTRLMVVLTVVYVLLAGGVALVLLLPPGGYPAADKSPMAPVPYSTGSQCRAAACEGKDPMRLICGISPETVTTLRTATGAQVELRHSRKCQAGWARIWESRIGDRLEVTADGPAHTVRLGNQDDTETYVYTPMAAAGPGSTIKVCFLPAVPGTERECVEGRVSASAPPSSPGPPGQGVP
ncbi:XRE family transcriptional regulator [Streptomyces kunmingensis]|uniref:XRE family transcriptional regulator n=1 Tax=Streptomyces kunmingensis TaxID=68225 RepID=A0ABU6CK97_9ACTN|nr:DUF2690 domain-containing protein [Streptomyces kunmingensis]MEB3965122.1 XRE family transcriptional regulator [Streptomyces kunmingensis]